MFRSLSVAKNARRGRRSPCSMLSSARALKLSSKAVVAIIPGRNEVATLEYESNRRVNRGLLRQPPARASDILGRDIDMFFEAHQLPVAGRRHERVSRLAGDADHGVVGPQRIAENMPGAEGGGAAFEV